ncbi:MAG: nucleotide exchange factor GrpE [Clostridiales bacterium]|jgi:molecular chaperone GrpE (heat shock protein)|nr:nucleotide exchange factor GrpE [Clostridiales bacterium]
MFNKENKENKAKKVSKEKSGGNWSWAVSIGKTQKPIFRKSEPLTSIKIIKPPEPLPNENQSEARDKPNTLLSDLMKQIRRLGGQTAEVAMNTEELAESIAKMKAQNNAEKEKEVQRLVDALITVADFTEDFYLYAKDSGNRALHEQASLFWNSSLKKFANIGLIRINDLNTMPEAVSNRVIGVEIPDCSNPVREGAILRVIRSGYMYKGSVVRKSEVIVAGKANVYEFQASEKEAPVSEDDGFDYLDEYDDVVRFSSADEEPEGFFDENESKASDEEPYGYYDEKDFCYDEDSVLEDEEAGENIRSLYEIVVGSLAATNPEVLDKPFIRSLLDSIKNEQPEVNFEEGVSWDGSLGGESENSDCMEEFASAEECMEEEAFDAHGQTSCDEPAELLEEAADGQIAFKLQSHADEKKESHELEARKHEDSGWQARLKADSIERQLELEDEPIEDLGLELEPPENEKAEIEDFEESESEAEDTEDAQLEIEELEARVKRILDNYSAELQGSPKGGDSEPNSRLYGSGEVESNESDARAELQGAEEKQEQASEAVAEMVAERQKKLYAENVEFSDELEATAGKVQLEGSQHVGSETAEREDSAGESLKENAALAKRSPFAIYEAETLEESVPESIVETEAPEEGVKEASEESAPVAIDETEAPEEGEKEASEEGVPAAIDETVAHEEGANQTSEESGPAAIDESVAPEEGAKEASEEGAPAAIDETVAHEEGGKGEASEESGPAATDEAFEKSAPESMDEASALEGKTPDCSEALDEANALNCESSADADETSVSKLENCSGESLAIPEDILKVLEFAPFESEEHILGAKEAKEAAADYKVLESAYGDAVDSEEIDRRLQEMASGVHEVNKRFEEYGDPLEKLRDDEAESTESESIQDECVSKLSFAETVKLETEAEDRDEGEETAPDDFSQPLKLDESAEDLEAHSSSEVLEPATLECDGIPRIDIGLSKRIKGFFKRG